MSGRIAVGVIRKAHGVRGEASVEPWTDSPDRFDELTSVTLVSPDEEESRTVAIESTRAHGERALIKFSGIDTPEAVRFARVRRIDHAYVVIDHAYFPSLEVVRPFLAGERIVAAGRYGGWNYSSMEDALHFGRDAAQEAQALLGGGGG